MIFLNPISSGIFSYIQNFQTFKLEGMEGMLQLQLTWSLMQLFPLY